MRLLTIYIEKVAGCWNTYTLHLRYGAVVVPVAFRQMQSEVLICWPYYLPIDCDVPTLLIQRPRK